MLVQRQGFNIETTLGQRLSVYFECLLHMIYCWCAVFCSMSAFVFLRCIWAQRLLNPTCMSIEVKTLYEVNWWHCYYADCLECIVSYEMWSRPVFCARRIEHSPFFVCFWCTFEAYSVYDLHNIHLCNLSRKFMWKIVMNHYSVNVDFVHI